MPKVSVLLSIYKEPVEKIAPAVESILQQTFRDFEFLIAIDNPENTQAITYIENLARNDNRISLFVNEKNMGLGASLNRLIEAANGAYCARMDTEDISLPTRLEKQISYFENHPSTDLLFTQWKEELTNTEVRYRTPHPDDVKNIKKTFFTKSILLHPTMMVKTEVLKQNPYPAISRPEDLILFMDLISRNYTFALLEEVLYIYQVDLSEKYKKVRTYSENLLPALWKRIPLFYSNPYFWLYFARIVFEFIISRQKHLYTATNVVAAKLWRLFFRG